MQSVLVALLEVGQDVPGVDRVGMDHWAAADSRVVVPVDLAEEYSMSARRTRPC